MLVITRNSRFDFDTRTVTCGTHVWLQEARLMSISFARAFACPEHKFGPSHVIDAETLRKHLEETETYHAKEQTAPHGYIQGRTVCIELPDGDQLHLVYS